MIKKSYFGLLVLFLIILCAAGASAYDDLAIEEDCQLESVGQPDCEISEIGLIEDSEGGVVSQTGDYNGSVRIVAENVYMYYKDGTRFNAYLVGDNGAYVGGALLKINVAGLDYYKKTNDEGLASLSINLNPGVYPVVTSYGSVSVKSVIAVNDLDAIETLPDDASIIVCEEFVTTDGNTTYFNATLLDGNDDPFVNQPLRFILNGVIYNKRTNDLGMAMIPIDLDVGVYPITVSYGVKIADSRIVVLSSVPEKEIIFDNTTIVVEDIFMNYMDGTRYVAQLLDENGTAISNAKIGIFINDTEYNATTDAEGIVYLDINFEPGNYSALAIYGNSTGESMILVNSPEASEEVYSNASMEMDDFEMSYGDGSLLEVNLTNVEGLPIANAQIRLVVGDKFYNRRTNARGIAEFEIDFIPGSYNATAYYGDLAVNSTIEVKSSDKWYDENLCYNSAISAPRLSMVYRDGSSFIASLTDEDGKGVSGARITFTIGGKDYVRVTDEEGNAAILINLKSGYYPLAVSYRDSKGDILAQTYSSITVVDAKYDNKISKVDLYVNYYSSGKFTVFAEDKNGLKISNEVLDFYCNGVHYYRTTNAAGIASFGEDLPLGTYNIEVSFKDKERLGSFKLLVTINVVSFIECSDFEGQYGGDNRISVKFYDNFGNPYENREVIFSDDSHEYKLITDFDGIVKFNAGAFNPGSYVIYATHPGVGESKEIKVTIKPAKDYLNLNFQIGDDSATISVNLPENGQAIFEVNGEQYFVNSVDKVASLHLDNLEVGKYSVVVSFEYPNYISQNKVFTIGFDRVNILMSDVAVYYGDEASLFATLYDKAGNPIKNKDVFIKINGEVYKVKTDDEGFMELNGIFLDIGSYTVRTTYVDDYKQTHEKYSNILVSSRVVPIATVGFANENSAFSFKMLDLDGNPQSNKNVSCVLNGEKLELASDKNGTVNIVANLTPGSYDVLISYESDGRNLSESLNIMAYGISLNATVVNYTADVVAEVPYGTGNVIFDVDGEKYTVPIKNGNAKLYLDDLDDGDHVVTAAIEGTHVSNVTSLFVDLHRQSVNVAAKDIEMYYKNGTSLIINVTDKSGNPLSGEKVQILINGVPYSRTINNGTAKMDINLVAGHYIVQVSYKGSNVYRPSKNNVSIIVKETIAGEDIVKVFKNDTAYEASFFDSHGDPLVGVSVDLNINGVVYHRKTNETGGIRFAINLNPGTYILTAINPLNGETYSNKIVVIYNMVSEDFTMYYRNGSQYKMTLLDNQGNPVGANVTVKLNINGVFYERRTNATGGIKFNINLSPGVYVITAIYNGLMKSNKVTVLSPIQGKSIEMYASDRIPFTALILDGQGQVEDGVKVTLNVNGVMYTRTVSAANGGIISLNINLAPADYIITVYYPLAYVSGQPTLAQSYNIKIKA